MREMNNARTQYYQNAVLSASSEPRSLWSTVKKMLHSKPTSPALDLKLARKRAIDFLAYFNDKLAKIRSTIATNLTGIVCTPLPPLSSPPPSLSVFSSPVTVSEVSLLIKSLSTSKSAPVDVIPVALLKSCSTVFSPLLATLFNLCFTQGVYPTLYKTARVSPLLKKPSLDPDDPASYRPISNLRTIGKLLERTIHSRLSAHLLSCASFSAFQSAYRPCHSTESALIKVTNDILVSTLTKSPSLVLSLDLSATFDCISHHKLLDRLAVEFGVSGMVHNLLTCYLTDRFHYVNVCGECSTISRVSTGVPQGSVLGPLLFSAYISPLQRLVVPTGISHVLYADDVTLYVNLDSGVDQMLARLNDCATSIAHWLMFNDLLLNPSKSEALVAGTHHQVKTCTSLNVVIAGVPVPQSSSIKLLGVTIDSSLSFDAHVSEVCRTAAYHLKAFRHIRKSLDKNTANILACSYIASRLDYCNAIFAGMTAHNVGRLQRIQNASAKIVLNMRGRTNSVACLRELHWLPVSQRIDYKIALTVYKTLLTGQPSYLKSMLSIHQPVRSLRSANNGVMLEVVHCRTAIASRAFSNYAPHLWNGLPRIVRNCFSDPTSAAPIESFKKLLKTALFEVAFGPDVS